MRRWPAPSYPTGTRHPHPSRSFRPTVRPVLSVRSPACLASTDKNGSASSLPSASSSLRHSYPHVRRLYYFSHLAYSTQVPAVCEGQTGTLETEKPIIRIFFDVWEMIPTMTLAVRRTGFSSMKINGFPEHHQLTTYTGLFAVSE